MGIFSSLPSSTSAARFVLSTTRFVSASIDAQVDFDHGLLGAAVITSAKPIFLDSNPTPPRAPVEFDKTTLKSHWLESSTEFNFDATVVGAQLKNKQTTHTRKHTHTSQTGETPSIFFFHQNL